MKEPGSTKCVESGLIGAEHRVRTGDLRLGKATSPRRQASPTLTNGHQPSQIIRVAYRLRRRFITNDPQPCTTVVFHRCSKTVHDRSTLLRSQSSWVGRRTRSVRPASAENSRTSATISTLTAFPVPQSLRPPRGTQPGLDRQTLQVNHRHPHSGGDGHSKARDGLLPRHTSSQ
jgi:hypothetical protein